MAAAAADRGRGRGRRHRRDRAAAIKWPNDVLLDGRKLAGILAEARPQEGWAVLGIGVNVAVREADLPAELRGRAASLGLEPAAIEPTLDAAPAGARSAPGSSRHARSSADYRARDALRGRRVRWADGEGIADGIDDAGRLLVERSDATRIALDAGEVHLLTGA